MEPSQNKIIVIPFGYTAEQRERIGQDILRRIRTRTESGIDINGNLFAGYSKNYKAGQPDLKLSGDMLSDLEVISHGAGFITIGFNNIGSNDKAAWNQSPRGQKANAPKRKFVGVSQAELNDILEFYTLGF